MVCVSHWYGHGLFWWLVHYYHVAHNEWGSCKPFVRGYADIKINQHYKNSVSEVKNTTCNSCEWFLKHWRELLVEMIFQPD